MSDPIGIILNPRLPREDRETALKVFAMESWERGWNDCQDAFLNAVRAVAPAAAQVYEEMFAKMRKEEKGVSA